MHLKTQTKELLFSHFQTYPQLTPADLLKFLHQSAFGCEHLLAHPSAAVDYIRKEAQTCVPCSGKLIEDLDGQHCRVHLDILREGLSAETFGKLFFLSASVVPDGKERLEEKLIALEELLAEGKLPFSPTEVAELISQWRSQGFPARHHSEEFRTAYHPAYRVIRKDLALFLPLFIQIDHMLADKVSGTQPESFPLVTLAIEGGSASGKSTLGSVLEQVYGCTLMHMDDFFLQPHQRTPERFAQPGGNVDRERFLEEVLQPLSRKESVQYRPFDCSSFTIQPPVSITPEKLVVIEGAYSMHPELADHYDFSVFLDIDPALQKSRINKRNSPAFAQRFFNEWIPMEHRYFEVMQVQERCNLIISVKNC